MKFLAFEAIIDDRANIVFVDVLHDGKIFCSSYMRDLHCV